jgi:hypothetical protein
MAIGLGGTDTPMEAARLALIRDDWTLVPELFQITGPSKDPARLCVTDPLTATRAVAAACALVTGCGA